MIEGSGYTIYDAKYNYYSIRWEEMNDVRMKTFVDGYEK